MNCKTNDDLKLLNVSRKETLVVVLLVAASMGVLISMATRKTGGHLGGMIDDVYIHLQYAKMIAKGRFFEYCEGCGFSKGETSPLYAFLLAPAFWLGLTGERALLWAFGLAFAATSATFLLIIDAAKRLGSKLTGWLTVALCFLHFELIICCFSGMEVGLAAALLALWANTLVRLFSKPPGEAPKAFAVHLITAAIAPALRPELFAASLATAALVCLGRIAYAPNKRLRNLWFLPVPFAGQAAVSLYYFVKTGSVAYNSALSKSYFTQPMITFGQGLKPTLENVWNFFFKTLLGRDSEPHFAKFFLVFFAAAVLFVLIKKSPFRRFFSAVLPVITAGLLIPQTTYSVSWGLYRYSQPFFPWLFFALAFLLAEMILSRKARLIAFSCAAIMYLAWFSASTHVPTWAAEYADGVNDVHRQQRRVGDFIRINLPKDAVIGINDAGAIAYFSERRVFDALGLVTEDMAVCFKRGNGCLYEHFKHMDRSGRPTHFATYPDWYYDKLIFGEEIFRATAPKHAMVGAFTKFLYAAKWDAVDAKDGPQFPPPNYELADEIDVGSLRHQRAHGYEIRSWKGAVDYGTAFREFKYKNSKSGRVYPEFGVVVPKGKREVFKIKTKPGKPLMIMLRTDAYWGINAEVKAGTMKTALTWKHDQVRDAWVDASIILPKEAITDEETKIEILNNATDVGSFHYWFYQPRD